MKALLRCDGLRVRKQRKISDLRWLALLTIWWIWFLKFSLELINTLKSSTVSTCAITLVPSEKGKVILCEPIVIVLEYDMLNCQSEDHCSIMSSWFWRMEGSVLEKELYSLMSSANNLTEVEVCKLSTISLMKRMNKRGPRTLPCGTPLVTGWDFDSDELILTDCVLLDRKETIQWCRFSLMP